MPTGIGISNVHERLRLLYGDQFKMDIQSQAGQGTQIRIEIPDLITALPTASSIKPASHRWRRNRLLRGQSSKPFWASLQ